MLHNLVGIDEVGRGAWAGPLLVVAVQTNKVLPADVKDSKLTTRLEREKLTLQIRRQSKIGEGWATPGEIDEFGMTEALKLATKRALKIINASYNDQIIIDGHINFADKKFINVTTQIKADEYVPIVSSASIVAKVMRDAYMRQLGKAYPNFGFDTNVGYGTAKHGLALKKFGPIAEVHRFSFKPVIEQIK